MALLVIIMDKIEHDQVLSILVLQLAYYRGVLVS